MSNSSWYAIIITQIIAESLPISSSGHVALVSMLLGISLYSCAPAIHTVSQSLIARSVDHFLHGPTCVIVALFFFDRWWGLLRCWRKTMPLIVRLIIYVGIADCITGLFFIGSHWIPHCTFPLGLGFLITALALASLAWCDKKGASLTIAKMIVLGIVQGIALLPGISRFACTYTASRWLGLSSRHALETTWMIQVPLMVVSFLHSLIIFRQMGIPVQILNLGTALVMMGASIGGWYALRFAAYASAHNKMWWFACYLIIPLIVWVICK